MKKAQKVMIGLLTACAIGGLTVYIVGHGHESTDDAQIEGRIVTISSRVSGQVLKVLVADNQIVHAGDPLVELDSTELQARLAAARADLSAAEAALTSSQSDVAASRSKLRLAELDLQRIQKLHQDGVVSQSEVDTRRTQYDQARASYDQAVARFGSGGGDASAKPDSSSPGKSSVGASLARVQQAEAALKLAEVNLSYATIRAPIDGAVSRRSVETGQVVAPLTPLMALVSVTDVWVVGNFKEDQLRDLKPGQEAEIKVDSYPSLRLKGTVDSIAAATGSKFALIPPDNASGNFTKVVQRVPVLVRFKEPTGQDQATVLRPGMSANLLVHTL